jgi:agmatine/peptidylarginine deiminase
MSKESPYLYAAWQHQKATLMTWPKPQLWVNCSADNLIDEYVYFLEQVALHQPVLLLVDDQRAVRDELHRRGVSLTHISLVEVATNDCWARDYGPIQVGSSLVNPQFDGWGKKFDARLDNAVNRLLFERGEIGELTDVEWVFEGGGIESDGAGTLLVTRQCILDEVRNGSDTVTIDAALRKYFAAERVLYLENSLLQGDDTDGHVDLLARFLDPSTIAYARAEPDHPDYESLHALEEELRALRDREGRAYKLVPVGMPQPVRDATGELLPATYLNFALLNSALLVPAYNQPERDEAARQALGCYYPEREAISVPSTLFIHQGGSLHCMCMELY